MIKFNELLERAKSEKIVVHTPTEEQAKALLTELDKKEYTWGSRTKLTTRTNYEDYKENTCYALEPNNTIYYSSFIWYQEHGYTIIEFKDIDFAEKTVKKAELKLNTHIVIKRDDLDKYLNPAQVGALMGMLSRINKKREESGKKVNDYYVINTDEPYAKKVLDLILEEEAKKGKVV